jgi:hypothetical protein
MLQVQFEPTTPVFERAKAVPASATVIVKLLIIDIGKYEECSLLRCDGVWLL